MTNAVKTRQIHTSYDFQDFYAILISRFETIGHCLSSKRLRTMIVSNGTLIASLMVPVMYWPPGKTGEPDPHKAPGASNRL
jgi:hypothetical protein